MDKQKARKFDKILEYIITNIPVSEDEQKTRETLTKILFDKQLVDNQDIEQWMKKETFSIYKNNDILWMVNLTRDEAEDYLQKLNQKSEDNFDFFCYKKETI